MIKCIVIDVDQAAQQLLIDSLKKIPGLEILGAFNNPLEALYMLQNNDVDLVFSEIKLPDLDGISFYKSLLNPPLFVFVTSDPSYAIASYELNVLDYILKPFGMHRLLKTLEKAQAFLAVEKNKLPSRNFLIIKDRSNIIISSYNEVFYIKGDRDYVWIETRNKKYHVWRNLKDMETLLLTATQFVRIHKSYIVNLDFAIRVEGQSLIMKGHLGAFPIGPHYKAELYRRLGLSENE